MKPEEIPDHDFPWQGGVLLHDRANDNYLIVRFGDGTNDPNDEAEFDRYKDEFDDYLITEVFLCGEELRKFGWASAKSDDGYMIPIHRRDHESGQIRDWIEKACDVSGFEMSEMDYVSLVG